MEGGVGGGRSCFCGRSPAKTARRKGSLSVGDVDSESGLEQSQERGESVIRLCHASRWPSPTRWLTAELRAQRKLRVER